MGGTHDATAEPSLLMSLGRNGGGQGGLKKKRDTSGNNKSDGRLSKKEE